MLSNTGGNDRASAANEFDEVEASRDELVSGGSGPVRYEAQDMGPGGNEFDEDEACRDELVSGGSGPVRCEAQDTGLGGMVDVPLSVTALFLGFSHLTKPRQEMQRFLLLCPTLCLCQRFLLLRQTLCRWLVCLITVILAIM
jgi:hypothetical protein